MRRQTSNEKRYIAQVDHEIAVERFPPSSNHFRRLIGLFENSTRSLKSSTGFLELLLVISKTVYYPDSGKVAAQETYYSSMVSPAFLENRLIIFSAFVLNVIFSCSRLSVRREIYIHPTICLQFQV